MVAPHHWAQCRPALITLDGQPDLDVELLVETVWATTPEATRQAFHRVCCCNSRTPADLALARHLVSVVTQRLNLGGGSNDV